MKTRNKKILISVFVFFILLLFSISIIIASQSFYEDSSINKEKVAYQIKYLDSKIIEIANLLNELEDNSNSNQQIHWEELQTNVNILYNYWNNVILDLNTIEIEKQLLTEFGKKLDDLTLAIKNKNKELTLNNLVALYSKLTIYAEKLDYNENFNNLIYAKYNLLIAYSIAEKMNWTLIYESVLKSDEYLLSLVNSLENIEYSQYNINQAYVAIKELENLINIQDLDVFYLKYKIAMEKLENM